MSLLIQYAPDNGKIVAVFHLTEESDPAVYTADGGSFLTVDATDADPELQYVDTGADPVALIDRPLFPTTLDKETITANYADTATISGIPPNTLVNLGTEFGDFVNDGTFEFASGVVGLHTITLVQFPYLNQTYTITAT